MAPAKALLVVLLVLAVAVLPGCIEEPNEDPDDDDLPLEGTTKGFRMPDFQFVTEHGISATLQGSLRGFIILQIIGDSRDPFMPQFAQIRAARTHFTNVSFDTVTLFHNGTYDRTSIYNLGQEVDADWSFALVETDVLELLSIQKFPTIFILNDDHVILERSNEALGQGRIIQVIEATWGIEPPPDVAPQLGNTVPDLVWRDVNGTEGRLSDLRGSPVILNVWEMECPFCMQLFVELEKVYANYSGQGLQMVSIDLITWETEEQVRSVMEDYNATWTFAIDGDNIQSRYDIWRLPLLVLLNGDGVVQWTWTGYTHHSVIDEEVEKLI